jgi:hypothetical protein
LVAGTLDAVRGVAELGNGQPLTTPQVDLMTPHLASAFQLPAEQVRSDLEAVRLYVGGPAAKMPGWAVQLDHSTYVAGQKELERILSWQGRRWLVHEMGHVMQWRQASDGSDLDRTRRGTAEYLTGFVVDDRWLPGAAPRGLWNWASAKIRGAEKAPSISDAIHDAHHIERQTERQAVAFRDATS